MSQDVTYNIKGTSDVPQQTEKAKKAMSEMDKQAAAIGKKFSEAGKDLFLSSLPRWPSSIRQSALLATSSPSHGRMPRTPWTLQQA